MRKPNVLFLQDPSGPVLIYRFAWTYTHSQRKWAAQPYANRVDYAWLETFNEKVGGVARARHIPSPRSLLYLAEPYLLGALESLYRESDIPRITPELKLAEVDDERQQAFFVRPFLDQARDRPASVEAFGKYIGTLGALRIVARRDRNPNHYCWTTQGNDGKRGVIVNIDPDFYFYAYRLPGHVHEDARDFYDTVKQFDPVMITHKREFDDIRKATEERFDYAREGILDSLPLRMEDLFERFETVEK